MPISWEYLERAEHDGSGGLKLDDLGRDGWELVAIIDGHVGSGKGHRFFFKRLAGRKRRDARPRPGTFEHARRETLRQTRDLAHLLDGAAVEAPSSDDGKGDTPADEATLTATDPRGNTEEIRPTKPRQVKG